MSPRPGSTPWPKCSAASGVIAERYQYADYGHPTFLAPDGRVISTSYIGNYRLFTGRYYDVRSGWYYFRMRYLNALTGEFTTRDPVGLWGNEINLGNGYTYAANNPTRFMDPMGLSLIDPQSAEETKKARINAINAKIAAMKKEVEDKDTSEQRKRNLKAGISELEEARDNIATMGPRAHLDTPTIMMGS